METPKNRGIRGDQYSKITSSGETPTGGAPAGGAVDRIQPNRRTGTTATAEDIRAAAETDAPILDSRNHTPAPHEGLQVPQGLTGVLQGDDADDDPNAGMADDPITS
jgi:hypothetical protein